MLCTLSPIVNPDISIVGSLIEMRPPSLNEMIYFPILEPPMELIPESHALYSKNPENLYRPFGPSNMKLVMGGWCEVYSP